MEYFEAELLPTLAQQPSLWLRYVDYVLLFWTDELEFEAFFRDITGLVPSIKFTTEWEADDMIPFLDTNAYRLTIRGFPLKFTENPRTVTNIFTTFPGNLSMLKNLRYFLCSFEHIELVTPSTSNPKFPRRVIDQDHCLVKRKIYCPKPSLSAGITEDEPLPPVLSLPHN